MKRSRSPGFTLVEMLIVISIIAVLTGLVLGVFSLVQGKAARARASGEIKAISAALEHYKADNGAYVRNDDTDALDPRVDGNPTVAKYQKANIYLYSELSGDRTPEGNPDGKVDSDPDNENTPVNFYMTFKPSMLYAPKNNGGATSVKYIQDPYSNCYGYSTAGALEEEKYQADLLVDSTKTRPAQQQAGFSTLFDLWSTGGVVKTGPPIPADYQRWITTWAR